MPGTIRATTNWGDVVFSIRTGKVVKGNYRGIEDIDQLDVHASAKNLGLTVAKLREQGIKLVYCTFTLKSGGRHEAVPYPYEVKK